MKRRTTLNVLALGAHPDDIELACYGTIAKYAARGDKVTMCITCKGNAGTLAREADEIIGIRAEEARRSAEIIGADTMNLGFGDAELFHNKESLGAVIDVFRQVRPDVVLTHPVEEREWHNDHWVLNQLCRDASIWATHHNLPWTNSSCGPSTVVPAIYEWDTHISGFDGRPTDYVDISDTFETKLKALQQHESQMRFLEEMFGTDYLEFTRINNRYRGIQAGVAHAEAFRRLNVFPHTRTEPVLP